MTTTLYPILSILKMTGLVPSEQQAIITRWSSIHPLMMDPPWRPAHMYLEIESHSSEQNGIFGPPATLSGSPDVFTKLLRPHLQNVFSSS